MNLLLAGIGAMIGASLRYGITNYGRKHWEKFKQKYNNLPFPTLFINLSGAFLLGLIFGIGSNVFFYALVGTGVMGGYTTFSTLNTELLALYRDKNYRALLWYMLTSYLGGLILVYVGFWIGSLY